MCSDFILVVIRSSLTHSLKDRSIPQFMLRLLIAAAISIIVPIFVHTYARVSQEHMTRNGIAGDGLFSVAAS